MSRRVLLVTCALLLAGCFGCVDGQRPVSGAMAPSSPVDTAPVGPPAGPIDDPSVPRTDAAGRSPSDAVLELIDTLNRRDWKEAYSQYAAPYIDCEQAVRTWTERDEQYDGFTVLETRVERSDLAFLRVRYTIRYNEADGTRRTATVDDPEAWWAVDKVSGRWETRWMPVQ